MIDEHRLGETKEKGLIDVVKLLFAMLIVLAHFAAEWGNFSGLVDYFFSLYIIVVPFFFCCSGYFLYSKINKCKNHSDRRLIYKNYILRIISLYLYWSIIYFAFQILDWVLWGATVKDVLHYFHTAIVFTTYPTIWFLPACAVAAGMIYWLNERLSLRRISIIAIILYVIGSLGYSYDFILSLNGMQGIKKIYEIYNSLFITTRNGIFNGFPWFFLGCLIAKYSSNMRKHRLLYCFGTMVFLALTIGEAVLIKFKFNSLGVDTVFFLIPFIFCLMMFLVKENVYIKSGKWMRNMSTLIFVSQRIFLTAIPTVFPPFSNILSHNSYLGAVFVLACVFGLSLIIMAGSKKYSILKKLW